MKKLFLTLALASISALSFSQNCCDVAFASNDGNMAAFASDRAFIASHLAPFVYNHISEVGGTMIQFATADGQKANGYVVKAKKKTDKWLFVYQEWWGLNDHIKRQADVFYNDLGGNVNVLALDMYDGKIAADASEAGKMMQGVVETRLENIVKGGLDYVGKKAKVANVGWCFGGGWSLKSAIIGGKQTVGSVMYYGLSVKDVEKLKTLNCDVLGLFATEQWISKEVIEEFAGNMKTAGKGIKYKIFNAAHAFANPSNPKYDEAASREAYSMAIAYLKKKFL
ncbi:dienelactone hydrolase family protein [Emticicia sp.]|uniref:dienelactone hydrolase family protein n=1 Tax=Emticicia sp. TaxID=1930953 RepID=UPI003750D1BD